MWNEVDLAKGGPVPGAATKGGVAVSPADEVRVGLHFAMPATVRQETLAKMRLRLNRAISGPEPTKVDHRSALTGTATALNPTR